MSIQELSQQMIDCDSELTELKASLEAGRQKRATIQTSLVGEIDRKIVERFSEEGKVKEFDVDGTKWYLLAMKDLGDIKQVRRGYKSYEQVWFKYCLDLPFHLYAGFIPTSLASIFKVRIDSRPDTFDVDAMMLVDCQGHRIHTHHTWEGHRAVPHWYVKGYIPLDDVKKAIRHYTDQLCYEQR